MPFKDPSKKAEYMKMYHAEHNAPRNRDWHEQNIKSRYGITIDEYNSLLAKQENRCACCDKHISELPKRLAVDHEHGEWGPESVRGLLCSQCNTGIGSLGDNIEGLERALTYLKEFYNGRG